MNKYYYQPTENYKSPIWVAGCLADILNRYAKESGLNSFQKGPFLFERRTHDTGDDVVISICLSNLPNRQIVRATYWISDTYRFNDSIFESGAWDSALEKEIDGIIAETEKMIAEKEKKELDAITARRRKEQEEKDKYEKYFLDVAK